MKKDNTRPGASPPAKKKVAQLQKRTGGEEHPEKENGAQRPDASFSSPSKVVLSEPEWKDRLTSSQYHVLREKGTEMPFSGKYDHHFEKGMYLCAACHEPLFASDTKFDSHCGWPAFWDALEKKVDLHADRSLGMARTEVTCAKCGGHLGHVFNDGPKMWGNHRPVGPMVRRRLQRAVGRGKRFCINSESLEFVEKK